MIGKMLGVSQRNESVRVASRTLREHLSPLAVKLYYLTTTYDKLQFSHPHSKLSSKVNISNKISSKNIRKYNEPIPKYSPVYPSTDPCTMILLLYFDNRSGNPFIPYYCPQEIYYHKNGQSNLQISSTIAACYPLSTLLVQTGL